MALPVFVARTLPTGSGATQVRAWPVGHASGDVAILVVESAGGEPATLSVPAGFVALPAPNPQFTGTLVAGTRLTLFWCRATSAAMASPTLADAGDHVVGAMGVWRGCVPTGDPWDVMAGAVKPVATPSASWPEVTTTVAECLLLFLATHNLDSAAAEFSTPTGVTVTERINGGSIAANGGGMVCYEAPMASAGASGTLLATVTSSVNASITLTLKPAVTTPPPSTSNPSRMFAVL